MTDMIERVARAMSAADSGPEGSKLFAIHWAEFGSGYRDSARAAIAALREPTPEMQSAWSTEVDRCAIQNYGGAPQADDLWTAGIDAALGEGGD